MHEKIFLKDAEGLVQILNTRDRRGLRKSKKCSKKKFNMLLMYGKSTQSLLRVCSLEGFWSEYLDKLPEDHPCLHTRYGGTVGVRFFREKKSPREMQRSRKRKKGEENGLHLSGSGASRLKGEANYTTNLQNKARIYTSMCIMKSRYYCIYY